MAAHDGHIHAQAGVGNRRGGFSPLAFVRLMATPDEGTWPMNLGNPANPPSANWPKRVINMTGSGPKPEFKPLPSDNLLQRCPDVSLARAKLAWEPVAQRQGLTQAIAYRKFSAKALAAHE